jgi:hypothetical protein
VAAYLTASLVSVRLLLSSFPPIFFIYSFVLCKKEQRKAERWESVESEEKEEVRGWQTDGEGTRECAEAIFFLVEKRTHRKVLQALLK